MRRCEKITNLLKNRVMSIAFILFDYGVWAKIHIEDAYNKCKKGYNNLNDWSFIDVKIKTDNHHPVTKRKVESTILIKYVYNDKTYNIVQEYRGDDNSIMESFPLYNVNEIKKYKSNKKFGNVKIMSAEYGDKDVTELVKSYLGPMNDFYYSLIEKSREARANINDIANISANDELNVDTDRKSIQIKPKFARVTGMDAWWILPEMLRNTGTDKKLIITDQFLNEYKFSAFDKVLLNNDKSI